MYDKDKNNRIIDEYDFFSSACSSTDCTGLIPSGIQSLAQWEYYRDLYPFGVPDLSRKDRSHFTE